jgi:hypothetical protein
MNRLSPALALVLAVGAGCGGGAEIPTLELGGSSGARLMNSPGRTPAEAYDNAYSQLTRAHYNVHRNLESRGQNQLGAREALAQILRCLETMKDCVPTTDHARFDPYLARYAGWLKDVENGTWGGSFLTDLERTEREVKSAFNPSSTPVLAEFPGARKETPPGPPLASDKVEVPVSKNPAALQAPKAVPEPTEVNPVVTLRILYRSWDRAHNELIAAYKDKKPCKAAYDDVVESLRLLKTKQTGDPAAKLQIYIEYYGGVEEKTKGFTALPEKTVEKDILDELDVAARVIRKEFNPDK